MDYNNPYQQPYQNNQAAPVDKGARLANAAMIVGILALVSVPMSTIIPAMVLGTVSIILAILSRGSRKDFVKTSKIALASGILALCLNTALIGYSIYRFSTDSSLQNQFYQNFKEYEGESFQDFIKDILNGKTSGDHTGNVLPNNDSSL